MSFTGKVLSNGVIWPAVARLVPPSRFGFAFGLIVLGQNLLMTLGPPLAGMLRDSFGPFSPFSYHINTHGRSIQAFSPGVSGNKMFTSAKTSSGQHHSTQQLIVTTGVGCA